MAVVYNSNQVKYGGRGYLDAKMQPVANLAALEALDSLELIEGMTVVVLNDGSGKPHDYWYIGGEWVKKDNGGGGDISELEQEVAEISGNVATIETTLTGKVDKEEGKGLSENDFTDELKSKLDGIDEGAEKNVKANWEETDPDSDGYIQNKPDLSNFVSKDTDELTNYYKKSEVYTKDEVSTKLDETLDAAADYTDEAVSGLADSILSSAKTYTDGAVSDSAQSTLEEAKAYADEKTNDLAGSGLAYNDGKLDVEVDGTSIIVNSEGKLHVIGGGSGGTEYVAGQYININGNEISVTGITPDEYATKDEIEDKVDASAVTAEIASAIEAETARTESTYLKSTDLEDYAKKSDVEGKADASAVTAEIASAMEAEVARTESTYVKSDDLDDYAKKEDIEGKADATAVTEEIASAMEAEVARTEETYLKSTDLSDYAKKDDVDEAVETAVSALSENIFTKEEVNEKLTENLQTAKDYTDEEVTEVAGALESEVQRAMSAETELHSEIESEGLRATEAESTLDTKIGSETSRAIDAENTIREEISAEANRAVSAETELASQIEDIASEGETLRNDINAEVERASAAETTLGNKIDGEKTRAEEEETNLRNAIEDETERALSAESSILESVNAEAQRAQDAENVLEGKVEAELNRASSAETQLHSEISEEGRRAIEAEEALDDKIDAEIARATEAEDGLHSEVVAESARATSAETALESQLESEIERATAEDEALHSAIDAEVERATEAEATLSDAISQESNRAHDAESSLSTAIEDEIERATLAESIVADGLSDVQTKLEGFDDKTVKEYVDESISSAVSSVYKVKGSVEFYVDLPTEGVEEGDVYNVETPTVVGEKSYPAGTNWVWVNGEPEGHWDPLGGTVDMSVVDAERDRAISAETHLQGEIDTKQDALVAGQYIHIGENNNISVTGITPDEYATKSELENEVSALTIYVNSQGFAKQAHVDEQVAETRQGAFIAATAWTAAQGYAYEEDVVDTAVDLLNRISASTSATTELINNTASALTQTIDEEKSRAEQAEADLLDTINAEHERAVSAETDLGNTIQEAVQAETDRAQEAESGLLDAVNAEKARAQETESGLRELIDDETERAELAEVMLEDAIDQETSRATSAETQLSQSVNNAMSAITNVSSQLASDVERLEGEIAAATPVLKEDLTTSISVGGVSAGTLFSAGTSIESILIMLFGNGSSGQPTTQKYAYYGSVDDSQRMYEEDPLPEEEFNEQNIKARLTRSSAPVSVTDEFEFTVNADDNQIVVAIPATMAINSATDLTNNINYTGSEEGIVSLTIDSNAYKAYSYVSDSGFGQFRMKITLKNA